MAQQKTVSRERLTTMEKRDDWTRDQLQTIRKLEEKFNKAKKNLTMARQAVEQANEVLKNGLAKDLQLTISWGDPEDVVVLDDEPEDLEAAG